MLLSSNAYAFFIKTGRENLVIVTDPPGAICELKNNKGTWSVLTPDKIKVKRSKQALKITCTKDEYKKFTRSYNLRDPKTFDYDYDLALSTGATIGSAASGDIFDLVWFGSEVIADGVMKKFGTYTTHKKDGKPFIFIKLNK